MIAIPAIQSHSKGYNVVMTPAEKQQVEGLIDDLVAILRKTVEYSLAYDNAVIEQVTGIKIQVQATNRATVQGIVTHKCDEPLENFKAACGAGRDLVTEAKELIRNLAARNQ